MTQPWFAMQSTRFLLSLSATRDMRSSDIYLLLNASEAMRRDIGTLS